MQWSTIPNKSWWNLHWAGAPAPCSLCSAETLAPWFGIVWGEMDTIIWNLEKPPIITFFSKNEGTKQIILHTMAWFHTTKRAAPWPRQAAIEAPPSESSAWRCRCLSSDIWPILRRATGDWLSLRKNLEVQPPFKRYKWTSQALISVSIHRKLGSWQPPNVRGEMSSDDLINSCRVLHCFPSTVRITIK